MKFDLTKRMLTTLAIAGAAMGAFVLAEKLFGEAGFAVAIVLLLVGVPLAIDISLWRTSK